MAHAAAGLVILHPDEYERLMFKRIMDPKEDARFREILAGAQKAIPEEILREHKDLLYECLYAADANGLPMDMVRLMAWQVIGVSFRDRPTIVLSSKDSPALGDIRSAIKGEVTRGGAMPLAEEERMMNEKLEKIVRFYSEASYETE
jgi:hypothetical protein